MKTISIVFIMVIATSVLAGEINLENPSSPFYDVVLHESLGRKIGLSPEEIARHNEKVAVRRLEELQKQQKLEKERERQIEEYRQMSAKALTEIGRFQGISSMQGDGISILDTKLGHVWTFNWQNRQIEYNGQVIPTK